MDDTLVGLLYCLISAFGFGSMFTPLRNFETRDGFFVQWVQGGAIMVFALIVNVIRGAPTFQPGAALAGIFWSTGNITAIPIVNRLGAGLGLLVWGSVQVIVGWATGRFGLFGLEPEVPDRPWMNYVGLALTLISGVMFAFVHYEPKSSADPVSSGEDNHAMEVISSEEKQPIPDRTEKSMLPQEERSTMRMKEKLFYLGLSAFAGVCYGEMLSPVVYVQQHVAGASQEGLDYVLSHYSGVFVAATVYFTIYCCVKKNKPFINQQTVLPSIIYGLLWSFAMAAWIVSNKMLTQAVSFPIATRLPGIVGSCYDVFIFKAIKGTRNLTLLASAIAVALVGVVLVGLSK
uniref:Transmembrane protein 144 n=1 Tax=Plectus sambesii TaxID=2011161 RepID=A0A914WF73_9BILA